MHPDLRFGFRPRWRVLAVPGEEKGPRMECPPCTQKHIAAHPPSTQYRQLQFDTLTHDRPSLLLLSERVGWDHIMLGTAFLSCMAENDAVTRVEEADLGPGNERRMLESNADTYLRPIPAK